MQSTTSISETNREIMDQVNSSLARVKLETAIKDTADKSADDLKPADITNDDQDQEIIEETRNTPLEGMQVYWIYNNVHILM